jgi:hypothetical protein
VRRAPAIRGLRDSSAPPVPLAPEADNHRLTDMQISRLLRLRADRVLALLSDAGLVVTTGGESRQAA